MFNNKSPLLGQITFKLKDIANSRVKHQLMKSRKLYHIYTKFGTSKSYNGKVL